MAAKAVGGGGAANRLVSAECQGGGGAAKRPKIGAMQRSGGGWNKEGVYEIAFQNLAYLGGAVTGHPDPKARAESLLYRSHLTFLLPGTCTRPFSGQHHSLHLTDNRPRQPRLSMRLHLLVIIRAVAASGAAAFTALEHRKLRKDGIPC